MGFWTAVGTIIDIIEENDTAPRHVVVVERDSYQEVYPLIRRKDFDREKVEKAIKCFSANKAVNLDDLLRCLKCLDFDSGRRDLVNGLRSAIKRMSYFEKCEIAETFDFKSSIPAFID